jgi:hypothetical protein
MRSSSCDGFLYAHAQSADRLLVESALREAPIAELLFLPVAVRTLQASGLIGYTLTIGDLKSSW